MAVAPPCISHFSGAVSAGRVQNESQDHKKSQKNMAGAPSCISHFLGAVSASRVQNEAQNHTKQNQKWRALRPVFLTFREPFLQAEYKMKPRIINVKKHAGRSALYF